MEQVIRSTSSIDANLAASLIREASSAAFRNRAIGLASAIGITGLALSLGAAAILWANKPSLDPEMLRAALASMPALTVEGTVKLADDATVKLADGSAVTVTGTIPWAQPPIVLPPLKPDTDPAIKTNVTVFKMLAHSDGQVVSGWVFPSGNAKSPSKQYCYYSQKTGDGTSTWHEIANDRTVSHTAGVTPAEQATRFQKCQWWQGASS
jgi:hypothetical protein